GFAHVPGGDRVTLRVVRDGVKYLLHRGHEVAAQAGPLLFVPGRRGIELCLRGGAEDYGEAHGCNRERACALTCSQGTRSSGFASSSATRRSSSRRCASVRRGGCGLAAMVSQISCIRATRWSRGG